MFEISGKTALVTGANRGIGEAFVHALIEAGADKVYLGVRDTGNARELVQHFQDKIEVIELDLVEPQSIDKAAKRIEKLDILINNAGIISPALPSRINMEETARLEMETNYFGPMRLTAQLLPLLKQSPQAAIINIGSIATFSAIPSITSYSASKAALHLLTQGLRGELAKDNIRVIGVYPGPIDTRLAAEMQIDKPHPSQVAEKTFEALNSSEDDVFPDGFSQQMYSTYRNNPKELEAIFASMG